jgi:hypothetical protein
MTAFLRRSTLPHAVNLRGFVNANLQELPADVARSICVALQGAQFRRPFFELVVARTLQLLGTRSLHYEQESETGRRPDLTAVFDDGAVIVDATVPEFDADIVKDQARYQPLIELIEAAIPAGWSFLVSRLPDIGLSDSRERFKDLIQEEFAKLGNVGPVSEFYIVADHPQGEVRLTLYPRGDASDRAWIGGPATATFSDAERRIGAALHRKRRQLRGAASKVPVLVAIAGGMGDSLVDFDINLFGRTFERRDERQQIVELGFMPSGIWGRLRGEGSVLAGVIAYCHWQWTVGDDPVLYVNPRYSGPFPSALQQLRRRTMSASGVTTSPGTFGGLFGRPSDGTPTPALSMREPRGS